MDHIDWKQVRLELARTSAFPAGSANHGYVVRLPLDANGLIIEEEMRRLPASATVYRFSPDEPELNGYVIRTPRGWAFSYRPGADDDETVFHLETHPIRAGEYLTLTEPDESRLAYRVAEVNALV